jgi:hypothetical protein
MSLRKKLPKMYPLPFFDKIYLKTDLWKEVAQNGVLHG